METGRTMTPPQHVSWRMDTSLTADDRFAIFTAIPRPQHLAPTRYTWLQRISTCIFPDILLREAYSAYAYS